MSVYIVGMKIPSIFNLGPGLLTSKSHLEHPMVLHVKMVAECL